MVHKIDHSTLCWSMRGRYSLFTIDIYDWLVSLLERALVTMFSIRSAGRVVFKLSVITAKRSIRVGLAYVTYPPRWIYVIMRAVKLYIFHLANDVQQIFNGRLISSWYLLELLRDIALSLHQYWRPPCFPIQAERKGLQFHPKNVL